jgi:hypothetical protein
MTEDTKEMNLEEMKLAHVLKIIAFQCCCLGSVLAVKTRRCN